MRVQSPRPIKASFLPLFSSHTVIMIFSVKSISDVTSHLRSKKSHSTSPPPSSLVNVFSSQLPTFSTTYGSWSPINSVFFNSKLRIFPTHKVPNSNSGHIFIWLSSGSIPSLARAYKTNLPVGFSLESSNSIDSSTSLPNVVNAFAIFTSPVPIIASFLILFLFKTLAVRVCFFLCSFDSSMSRVTFIFISKKSHITLEPWLVNEFVSPFHSSIDKVT
mmetsp:Transcript_13209/g.24371  ORF Transcript_13209/g.24371 Transcript_13209/m.24371 type:complete len:218 (-) Transcript_13209:94-747(-)